MSSSRWTRRRPKPPKKQLIRFQLLLPSLRIQYEGKSISIEYRDAGGQLDRLLPLAAELVALNVDVIVTVDTPPTQAAKKATDTIPIVVAVSADPVGAGLVKSFAHPGGNTTGLALLAPETDQKALQYLKEMLPKTSRVVIIVDPKN